MLEIRLEQKQSDLASVRGDDLHFACTSEIRSPPGDVAALVEGDMVTSSACAGSSIARLPAQSRSAQSNGEYTSVYNHFC